MKPELILNEFLDRYFPGLPEAGRMQLHRYRSLLETYNQKTNLISRTDIFRITENHLIPSLAAETCLPLPPSATVADLGSGGGLPGIPLRIIRPDCTFILVDSSRKKSAFLRMVIHDLMLENTGVCNLRVAAGDIPPELKFRCDVVVARAVSAFPELGLLARSLLKPTGFLWAWKGERDIPELRDWARQHLLRFDVYAPPDEMRTFSTKLAELRLIAIRFD